jgi:hypothetical protein
LTKFQKLTSVEEIKSFFIESGYIVEGKTTSFPVSELIDKNIEGKAWNLINQEDLTLLIIVAEKYNQKSYRNKVNNYLRDLVGMKIIFFTHDFSHFNLTLIYNGIYNVKFEPDNPEMSAIRVLESLENKEELFDYTIEDLNIVLLERELTAKSLIESIKDNDNSSVKIAFQEGGLKLIGRGKDMIIISHDDAPISDMAIDVKLDYQYEKIKKNDIEFIASLYMKETGRKLRLICLITRKDVIYHWCNYTIFGSIGYINQLNENIMEDVLESLIAQVNYRTAFNSETFHQQFGTHSPFFILGLNIFNSFLEQNLERFEIMYREWKNRFSKVYQSGDLDQELFIKHSYLSLLVKTVLISRFSSRDVSEKKLKLENLVEIFEDRGVPIFLNDFFQWTTEETKVQFEIYRALNNAKFIIDDLFRTIYQEMVSPATRHALGEFYTPAPLAHRMIEEIYEFGNSVLDPACGSGTFLVETLKYIYNSNTSFEEKIEAISKLYGFDINPIAVLVARSNLLLLINEIFQKDKSINSIKIPINVYLTDSLNPINEFDASTKHVSLEKWSGTFGNSERFHMLSVNESIPINVKFFKYFDKFGDLLKELDNNLSREKSIEDIINKVYDSVDDDWLDELCEVINGKANKTLRENFNYIAEKIFNLLLKDQNHIWPYLLYNAVGMRKMKDNIAGVDLIIGNPPWLTIHDILSHSYKKQIKDQLRNSGIYVGGKQAPHAELCSLFFKRTSELYLKKGGKIFLVTTSALETGDHHSKFRMLKGFKDVFMWKFLDNVFNIGNICLGATYGNQPLLERMKIQTKIFSVEKVNREWVYNLADNKIYVPYNYKNLSKDKEAKRYIEESKINEMLNISKSKYIDKFYQGASLVPRNLIFIDLLSEKDNLYEIKPNINIGSKKPWDFAPYEKNLVEKDYIFDCAKSTELVPFAILSTFKVFLPLDKNLRYSPNELKLKAKKLYNELKNIYSTIQERDERNITDFWKNINHLGKLTNPQQKYNLKVVYNASGSLLKSAIVKNNVIIDTTLFYIGLDDLKEAYYLCAILNSPIISKNIKMIKSSRHIHKRPFSFSIPLFDKKDTLHNQISDIGIEIEEKVNDIILNLKESKQKKMKNRIKCQFCGKTYNKNTFKQYRDDHQKTCKNVNEGHIWEDKDWKDLESISIDEIILKRKKVKNIINKNESIKDFYNQLDDLVIDIINK